MKTKTALELQKENIQNLVLANPEEFKSLIKKTLPEFVKDVETIEDLGSAMLQAAQEMMLAVDDTLQRHIGLTDAQIQKFHQKLIPILKQTEEYEKNGLSILSIHDMSIVGDIAQSRFIKERAGRIGLETPILAGAAPFLKELKKANAGK